MNELVQYVYSMQLKLQIWIKDFQALISASFIFAWQSHQPIEVHLANVPMLRHNLTISITGTDIPTAIYKNLDREEFIANFIREQ